MVDTRAAEQEAERVRRCLATHGDRFEYRKTLGQGTYGVACLVRHNRHDGTRRDVVVKRALRPTDQRNLQSEVDIAKQIGGGRHFAMPIHIDANPLQELGGPIMAMEYLANGTLGDFVSRARSLRSPLPNRLLWRLFACLYRFVAGMAFPLRWEEGQEQGIELVPEGVHRAEGGRLVHGDMHPWNILIGGFTDEEEHGKIPILKLVDFGLAYEHPHTGNCFNDAIAENVFSVGEIMLSLIEREPYRAMTQDAQGQRVPRHPGGWVELDRPGRGVCVLSYAAPLLYHAHDGSWRNGHTDPDLLVLVARCLAVAAGDRPGLQALSDALAAGRRRDARHYRHLPEADNETSDSINQIVRDVMLQAPPAAAPRRRERSKSRPRRHRR